MSGVERIPTPSEDRVAKVERLRSLVDRTRPVSLAQHQVLPVLPALEPLLATPLERAGGPVGLRRGTVVGVGGPAGATALALALAAGPTRAGSWAAVVGLPELGWAAAAEQGVDLGRVVAVRPTERSRTTVVAALVDAFDVVVCGFDASVSAAEARRLTARARERGSVLVVVGGRIGGVGRPRRAWPAAADAELVVAEQRWSGLEQGAGHLRERRVVVEVGGRGAMQRPRRVELLLPDRSGSLAVVPDQADSVQEPARGGDVTPLRRVG